MIEKKRPRRKKPRINKNRTPNQLRTFETKGVNTPKTRGAISKALEKYTSLAQDAFSNGDRIVAESYYQFAEHYQRVLNENFEDEKSDNINPRFPKTMKLMQNLAELKERSVPLMNGTKAITII